MSGRKSNGAVDWAGLVLAVLAEESRHGYDLAREVQIRTEGELTLPLGTLYPVLHQLERDGFVASDWEVATGERRRRIYALTQEGRRELDRRLVRWRAVGRVFGRILPEAGS